MAVVTRMSGVSDRDNSRASDDAVCVAEQVVDVGKQG